MGGRKRVLLGATHASIENLGLIYLLGIARDEGWERKVVLVKDHDFTEFSETVKDFQPDVIGYNVYTGAHMQLFEALDRIRKDNPDIAVAVGGPHATYFPEDIVQHANFAVMSEGFKSFRRILRGEVSPGILQLEGTEPFPHPDRETFYRDSPEHANSVIKSIIGMTGCPYSCTYCYNSTEKSTIQVPANLTSRIKQLNLPILGQQQTSDHGHGMGSRLFPLNVRDIEDLIREGREIAERWPTKLLYFQDDVFGFKAGKGEFLEQLAERWPKEVGIPFHAQMRWEMTAHDSGNLRLDLAKKAGATGLTLAIEAADPVIREEVLDRNMPEETMYEGMRRLVERDLTVRTEQITALPYGATSIKTETGLEADISLLALNVDLYEKTGGPTMAWASTLAPYKKTKIGDYCANFGFYDGNNNDVPDEFFKRSVLRFPKGWIGPTLEQRKNDPSVWMSHDELERYRNQNAELRTHFNIFAMIPQGHKLARDYLTSNRPFSYQRLGAEIQEHLQDQTRRGEPRARAMLEQIAQITPENLNLNGRPEDRQLIQDLTELTPYLSVIPTPLLAAKRAINYARNNGNGDGARLTPHILSNAIRHTLYFQSLYKTGEEIAPRIIRQERYPPKV